MTRHGKMAKARDSEDERDVSDTRGGSFFIVGIGASAGGLEALEAFFSAMPADSGMAFVVVTHQHAGQPSMLAELLGRKTAMPVVAGRRRPSSSSPTTSTSRRPACSWRVDERRAASDDAHVSAPLHLPIDYFFRSLAEDQEEHAIGIVLSGTGSDGTLGLRAIKGEGGMVMAQDRRRPSTTACPTAPSPPAWSTSSLPPAEMPAQLIAYAARARRRGRRARCADRRGREALQQVFVAAARPHRPRLLALQAEHDPCAASSGA